MIRITKGLDIPISGEPRQEIEDTTRVKTVGLLGGDYIGMKPTMAVKEGDRVRIGQELFADKKRAGVRYTSPGAGKILAIHRGARRAFLTIIIQLDDEQEEEIRFQRWPEKQLTELPRQEVIQLLLESGLWTALRTRPFSMVADPATSPHSIFITAMDSNPLAPDMRILLSGREQDVVNGLAVISRLTDGKLFLCKGPELSISPPELPNLEVKSFSGPHPAGNVGTHIHYLDPVNRGKFVWHLGLQDTIAIGRLFTTGRICTERIISLGGPGVKNPRLLRTRLGANILELTDGEMKKDPQRILSGSVLSGAAVDDVASFLGRYHQQVSILPEGRPRELLSWLRPGLQRYSIKNVMLSKIFRGKKFDLTTCANGEKRAILPSYNYERVMPLDLLPLFLFRSLAINDIEEAERLGCLELDEEDLALCAFVCPSKQDFSLMLRRNLTTIVREG